MKLFYLLLAALLFLQKASAQKSYTITGTVISSKSRQPIEGATVKVLNGPQSFTNKTGRFTIIATQQNPLLTISHINYYTRQLKTDTIDYSNDIVIDMTENVTMMEEVTVSTGYQDLRKETATGSYDKIGNALFNRRVSTDILSRLEGISGIYFSKVIGNNTDIYIRGISTLSAGNSPLIVLDNFPYEGSINNLNPNDVESITVLKDAAAAAIWGAKAGNGVIVITTKKGAYGQKTQLALNANYTVQQQPNLFKDNNFLNSNDFIDVEKFLFSKGRYDADLNNITTRPVVSPVVEILAKQRAGLISQVDADRLINALRDIDVRNDYQKYLNQNSIRKQFSLNLSGGSNNVNYIISGGLDNNETTVKGNGNDRATFYSSLTIKPLRKLEFQTSVNYTFNKTENNGISSINPGGGKSTLYPYGRLVDDLNSPLAVEKSYRPAYLDTAGGGMLLDWKYRPLDEQNLSDNTTTLQDILLKARLSYNISQSFKAEVSGQLQRADNVSRNYYSKETFLARDLINRYSQRVGNTIKRNVPVGGILDYGSNRLASYALRGQINYVTTWGQNKINAIAGGEVREAHNTSHQGRTFGYDDNLLTYSNVDYITVFPLYGNLGNTSIFNNTDFGDVTNRFVSIYSNAAYTYKNKYTLSASARKDASNLFGLNTNQKWNPLWSTGLAWTVSDESFYNVKFFPFLKSRISYGYTGNIKNDLSAVATVSYTSAGAVINLPYAMVRNPANPDLRWEKTKIFNAGIDFATKNNRGEGSIDYYNKNCIDLLSPTIIDNTTGISQMTMNSANVIGKGFELKLNSKILTGKLKLDMQFLFNHVTNKITRYLSQSSNKGSYVGSAGLSILTVEGQDPYGIVSYRWGGLDPKTGDPLGYAGDTLSNNYSAIVNATTWDNLVVSGTARPKYYGNIIPVLSWKGIHVSVNVGYKFAYIFRRNSINYSSLFNLWVGHKDYEKRWQKPGDEVLTTVPSMTYPANTNRDKFYNYSEATVEKGDHIRVQDVSLNYEVKQLADNFFKSALLYIYINNPGILWRKNKSGLDPDYGYNIPSRVSISCGFKAAF